METKTAKILDGKTLAAKIQKELAKSIKEIIFRLKSGDKI